MSTPSARIPTSYMGRVLGLVLLIVISVINGIIHIPSGILLIFPEFFGTSWFPIPTYHFNFFLLKTWGIYTLFYGLLTIVFAYGLWLTKLWGWTGTVAIQIFCMVVDVFAALRIPLIPGVPEFAGIFEIPWYLAILTYLLQPHVRRTFIKPTQ